MSTQVQTQTQIQMVTLFFIWNLVDADVSNNMESEKQDSALLFYRMKSERNERL